MSKGCKKTALFLLYGAGILTLLIGLCFEDIYIVGLAAGLLGGGLFVQESC